MSHKQKNKNNFLCKNFRQLDRCRYDCVFLKTTYITKRYHIKLYTKAHCKMSRVPHWCMIRASFLSLADLCTADERRNYIRNVFSHWSRLCYAIDQKWAQFVLSNANCLNANMWLYNCAHSDKETNRCVKRTSLVSPSIQHSFHI